MRFVHTRKQGTLAYKGSLSVCLFGSLQSAVVCAAAAAGDLLLERAQGVTRPPNVVHNRWYLQKKTALGCARGQHWINHVTFVRLRVVSVQQDGTCRWHMLSLNSAIGKSFGNTTSLVSPIANSDDSWLFMAQHELAWHTGRSLLAADEGPPLPPHVQAGLAGIS